jgi:hypothetical protein
MSSSARGTRIVAWLALGCHVLVASGLPLPLAAPRGGDAARLAGKDRSRPFPCMDKPCGCATAEQCFASCCCHTPAQRLAWARAHDVDAAILAALERRVAAADQPAASCCAAARPQQPSCCDADASGAVDPEAPEVCGDYRSLAADPPPAATEPATAPSPRVVILRDALACGGILTAWLACAAAVPPPPRVMPPDHDVAAGTLLLEDDAAPSVSADRSAPPPRVG